MTLVRRTKVKLKLKQSISACHLVYPLIILWITLIFSVSPSQAQTLSLNSNKESTQMKVLVGEHEFLATLDKSETVQSLIKMLPLTLDMAEFNGNEKHASLPQALPTDDYQPGVIRQGDILLYGTRTLVLFYETFNSPYRYTKIGHIDDITGLTQALGRHNVKVRFFVESALP